MHFLVCGFGSIGYRHAKILKSLGAMRVSAWRTGKATLPELTAKEKELDQIFFDFDEALASRPDAALITNPSHLHIETALKLAKHKIPLFIEKPLSHNMDGVAELRKLASTHKIPVLIGFNLIFHPAILKIRELLAKNKLGQVFSARAHWGTYLPGWHPWENFRHNYAARSDMGGGAVLTLCHEINFLTELFGASKQVKAMETHIRSLNIDTEEGADILIRHESGVVSNTHLNFFQKPYRRSLEVIGEKGTLVWTFLEPDLKFMDDDHQEMINLGDKDALKLLDKSYEEQMRHFVRVVQREETPHIPIEKAVADQQLVINILKEIGR